MIKKCPICLISDAEYELLQSSMLHFFKCGYCGSFMIDSRTESVFQAITDRSLFPYLSAHTRQNSSSNNPIVIDAGNWESFALAHKEIPVIKKLDRFLKVLADKSKHPGSNVAVVKEDCPLYDVENPQELWFFFNYLKDAEYLAEAGAMQSGKACKITCKGWEKLETQSITGIPGQCFVAMSFREDLNKAWEAGIKPAIRTDCKMNPVRVDKKEHNEKICDKIIAEIRLSQFLIADFTFHRPGVYFEAGLALGLGKPVIWTCRKDEFTKDKMHFDTRQYNHIVWETPAELREKLRDRVMATILKKS